MTYDELSEAVTDLLVRRRRLSEREAAEALEEARTRGMTIEEVCLKTGIVTPGEYNRLLEEISGVAAIDPSELQVSRDFILSINELFSKEDAERLGCFPVSLGLREIHVVVTNPGDEKLRSKISALTGCRVRFSACHSLGIRKAIELYYEGVAAAKKDAPLESLAETAAFEVNKASQEIRAREESATERLLTIPSVIRFTAALLRTMIDAGVSDIHLENVSGGFRARGRLDGVLVEFGTFSATLAAVVLARVKAMAGIDIGTTGGIQEGRIDFSLVEDRDMDFRVSIIPGVRGQKAVIRILDRSVGTVELEELGFGAEDFTSVVKRIEAPNGLILVTGPTGSGKSTTLYSFLQRVNRDDTCILTSEDPVEYNIEGATQVQCSEESGISFADALRGFLRQDPDIIMLGEIRDVETADIAIKAAMTGHLVLSTLHTNDAVATVERLVNMGVEPHRLAAVLRLVVAQRLLRRLCKECRKVAAADDRRIKLLELDASGFEGKRFYEAGGCPACRETGYKGRFAIFEVLDVGEKEAELITSGASQAELRRQASADGMVVLRESAVEHVLAGDTSLEEVLRVTT